ncbi:MAG: hypothetical protein AAGJ93_18130, partial [Bacteroidota bacterium]
MKTKAILLNGKTIFTKSLIFIGCSRDKVDIVNQVVHQLDQLETVKHEAVFMSFDHSGTALWNDKSTVYFDLREKEKSNLQYYITRRDGISIYNGTESIYVDDINKAVIINDIEVFSPYSPIMFSLPTLKGVLPVLLDDKEVRLYEKPDTIIDGREGLSFLFVLEEGYIDWENQRIVRDFIDGKPVDTKLSVTVDAQTYLPILIVNENINQSVIYRVNEIDTSHEEADDKLWKKSNYAEGYTVQTSTESRKIEEDKLTEAIGKTIDEWTLPRLSNDSLVSTPKWVGNVVLLE